MNIGEPLASDNSSQTSGTDRAKSSHQGFNTRSTIRSSNGLTTSGASESAGMSVSCPNTSAASE